MPPTMPPVAHRGNGRLGYSSQIVAPQSMQQGYGLGS
jgi:hypothetical protein